MKFEKEQIHFLSDAFVADTVSVASASYLGPSDPTKAMAAKTSPKKWIRFHSIFIATVPTNLLCEI